MTSATSDQARAARRSARFVTWVRAWRAGFIPYDDVIAEIEATEDHLLADAAGSADQMPLREALATFSSLHPDQVRLVLPAPGDPRGLPGPQTPFTGEALHAGEGVLAGTTGLVPQVCQHTSGSGDQFASVLWRSFPLPPEAVEGAAAQTADATAAQAEAELAGALAEATAALTHLDVAQWRPELAGALADLRRHDGGGELPPIFDPRARRLYARASLLDRMLALADHTAPGGAVNAYEARQRDAALRPLTTACRRALVAACNAPLS